MNNLSKQLAKHFKEVYFGENWTWSNLQDNLEGVTWQQATTQVYDLNTIATLVFHINYYVKAVLGVLEGNSLDAKDKFSFDHPPIISKDNWESLKEQSWKDANNLIKRIEQLPDDKLWEIFVEEKYGNYLRNIQGLVEHTHYHLGQIALIKKIILQNENTE